MTSKQSGKENTAPIERVRFGGVTINIYANKVKDMPIPLYKATASRTYTENGEFKTVNSFRWEDLPCLIHAVRTAWARIEQLRSQAWNDTRKDAPDEAPEPEGGEEQ